MLCALSLRKLDRFWLEFSAVIPRLGGAEGDEGIEIFRRREGVYFEAGADGMPVADIRRKAGINRATSFNWKRKYTGCCRRCAPAEADRGRERQAAEGSC